MTYTANACGEHTGFWQVISPGMPTSQTACVGCVVIIVSYQETQQAVRIREGRVLVRSSAVGRHTASDTNDRSLYSS